MVDETFNVRRFIDDNFDPDAFDKEYPNARRFLTGSLFICHAGADSRRILDDVVYPVVYDRFADGYFLHNRVSGGSRAYKVGVRAALHWCDKFMVVISQNSVGHEWVGAEVDWALRNGRSVIRCLLDDSDPRAVDARLRDPSDRLTVDFRLDKERGRCQLQEMLDQMLRQSPYPRFPQGRPGWPHGGARDL
jgi:hypothetical protein